MGAGDILCPSRAPVLPTLIAISEKTPEAHPLVGGSSQHPPNLALPAKKNRLSAAVP